jgi:hypothetical protein
MSMIDLKLSTLFASVAAAGKLLDNDEIFKAFIIYLYSELLNI